MSIHYILMPSHLMCFIIQVHTTHVSLYYVTTHSCLSVSATLCSGMVLSHNHSTIGLCCQYWFNPLYNVTSISTHVSFPQSLYSLYSTIHWITKYVQYDTVLYWFIMLSCLWFGDSYLYSTKVIMYNVVSVMAFGALKMLTQRMSS